MPRRPFVVRRIIWIALDAGARLAEPGEFTRRAFLNGRMDLAEAEAVADIIAARSDSALANALSQLSGALSERVAELRAQVIAEDKRIWAELDRVFDYVASSAGDRGGRWRGRRRVKDSAGSICRR